VIVAGVSLPLFEQLLVSGIVVGSTYALIGVSFGIIYSTTRIFHLAHSVVYAVAAYIAVVAVQDLGLPLAAGVPVGILAGVAFGLLLESLPLVGYRALRKHNASLLGLFLASLGVTVAAPNLLQIIFGPGNRPLPGFDIHTHSVGSANYTNLDLVETAISWALVLVVIVFLQRTKYGRAITAVRTNSTMAAAVGVSPDVVYLLVFAIGSALVSVAGIFFAIGNVAYPQMGFTPVLTGFIAVFLGGIGSAAGAAAAGLLIGLTANLSGLWLSSNYQLAVVFGLMFVVLIVRPQGLFGRLAT
jgi:branched-chain amino acid transport system permease protein